jgi:RNA polymerase sigma factor (sigma-70 family)
MTAAANRWFKPHGEWVIPLRSWSLREQVRSLFVAPNTTGRKGPKMKLRNKTESTPNHGAARDAAILQDLDLVNRIARRFQRRVPPCVTFDDLASAGMIGLIHAVDRFDQTRGLKFRTYAQHRIRGAMFDFLRDEDPLSRTERRRVRESTVGLGPTTVSLNEIQLHRLAAPASPTFATCFDVREARRRLSPRENRVIALLYEFGCPRRPRGAVRHVRASGQRVQLLPGQTLPEVSGIGACKVAGCEASRTAAGLLFPRGIYSAAADRRAGAPE